MNICGLRVKRSKKAIYSSVLKLIQRKDFSEISVQDIVDDCGYSRACFYHTFEDKYNMLNIFVQDEAKAYIDYFLKSFSDSKILNNKDERYSKAGISAFEFIYSEREFYKALVSGKLPGHGKESFFKYANDYFIENASYPIEKRYPNINMDLYTKAMTSIMGSFIEYWISDDFKFPAEYMKEQLMMFLNVAGRTDFVDV